MGPVMNGAPIWAAVAVGGAIGAVARHFTSRLALHLFGPGFPVGTFAVNVIGSIAMGAIIAYFAAREPVTPHIRAFFAVGMLGAFTTFSTFSLDAVNLTREKAYLAAGGYIVGSVICSITGLIIGLMIARSAL